MHTTTRGDSQGGHDDHRKWDDTQWAFARKQALALVEALCMKGVWVNAGVNVKVLAPLCLVFGFGQHPSYIH